MPRYELLSIEEVSEQLGRKRWFVYKLLDSRRLPYHLIGGRRCVSQRDLDHYVARSRFGRTEKAEGAEGGRSMNRDGRVWETPKSWGRV